MVSGNMFDSNFISPTPSSSPLLLSGGNGGGLSVCVTTIANSSMAIASSTFSRNTAPTGGAISLAAPILPPFANMPSATWSGSNLTLTGIVASGNMAAAGGGLHLDLSKYSKGFPSVSLTNASFTNNSAVLFGGAVAGFFSENCSPSPSGFLALSTLAFGNNSAPTGGSLYLRDCGSTSVTDVQSDFSPAASTASFDIEDLAALQINGLQVQASLLNENGQQAATGVPLQLTSIGSLTFESLKVSCADSNTLFWQRQEPLQVVLVSDVTSLGWLNPSTWVYNFAAQNVTSATIACASCVMDTFAGTDGSVSWNASQHSSSCIGGDPNACSTNVCKDCDDDATCPGGNAVYASAGSWLCETTSYQGDLRQKGYSLHECPDGFCLADNTCGNNRDAEYGENPLCGQCRTGYARLDHECVEYDRFGGGYWVLWILINLALSVFMIAAAGFCRDGKVKILLYYFQIILISSNSVNVITPVVQLINFNFAASIPLVSSTTGYLTVQLVNPLVLVALAAVLLCIVWILWLSKPPARQRFENEGTLTTEGSSGCLDRVRHFSDRLLGFLNRTLSFYRTIGGSDAKTAYSNEHRAIARKEFVITRTLLLMAHGTYQTWTYQALTLVNCVSVCQFGSLLQEYPDVPCSGSTYSHFRGIAVAILVVLTFGFPLVLGVFLVMKRKKLHEPEVISRWGIFYEQYSAGLWWWPLQEYARRLLLVLGFVFIEDYTDKYYFVAVVSVFILVAHAFFLPFELGADNVLETVSLAVLTYAAVARAAGINGSDGLMQVLVYGTLLVLACVSTVAVCSKAATGQGSRVADQSDIRVDPHPQPNPLLESPA
eukprot:m.919992 g.919992  ORF g.919992 m.919992 type:complete len:831 (+) comp60686_c0_seq1:639-3131(+)